MNFDFDKRTNRDVKTGSILIAEPFLADPNFARSVILICEHNEEGTIGFVFNKETPMKLEDLLPQIAPAPFPVFKGGPVEVETLHLLHQLPEVFGGTEVYKGIYWGGSYDALELAINQKTCCETDTKLILGYSGWTRGQLEKEVSSGSWLVADLQPSLLFETAPKDAWQQAIQSLGGGFSHLAYLPQNPQLN